MFKKRGQVTVYVILGIVILFVMVIFGFLFFSGRIGVKSFSPDFDEVRSHVDGCIYQILEEGVSFYGNHDGIGYEADLADYIFDYLPLCVDFSKFERVEIESYRIDDVRVSLGEYKIGVIVEFPIIVKRGGDEKKFVEFYSEFPLRESGCVDISVDNGCHALEMKSVEMVNLILNYEIGDYVGVGGQCVAC